MNVRRASSIAFGALAALAVWISTSACEDGDDCCPISETPSCNFTEYGGSKSLNGGTCVAEPDSAPASSVKKIDANGCPYWEYGGRGSCGAASPHPVDASSDTDASDGGDADAGDGAISD